MSIFSELVTVIEGIHLPVETGSFCDKVPEQYVVLTPLTDNFDLFADNAPQYEVPEVRLTLFSKTNYLQTKSRIVSALLRNGFTITLKQYVGRDDNSGYHNYTIDVQKPYLYERNDDEWQQSVLTPSITQP